MVQYFNGFVIGPVMQDGAEEVDCCVVAADGLGVEEVVGGVGDVGVGVWLGEGGGDGGGSVLDDEVEVGEVLGEGAGGVACGAADLLDGVREWVCRYGRGGENVHLPRQPRREGKPSQSPSPDGLG